MANYFKAKVKAQTINQSLKLVIDKLDMNGVGVSRWNNKPIFVTGALPNEVVEVKVTEQKSKYTRAKLISIHKKNEHRVTPKCQHFTLCGGCDLQMLEVDEQLHFKQLKVNELFSRSFTNNAFKNNKAFLELPWEAAIQSNPWFYRRKARIGVQFDKQAQPTIGFRQKSTNQLAAIKSCPVLVKPLDTIFPLLKKLLPQLTAKSAIGHIEVIKANVVESQQQKDNQVILVIRQLKAMHDNDIKLWQLYAKEHDWHIIIDEGNQQRPLIPTTHKDAIALSYSLADNSQVLFSSSDFIQINQQVNIDMINQALAWLNIATTDNVLDLFCGLGNFSLAIAKSAKQVVGVEGMQAMVDKAKRNSHLNQLDNCHFYQADLNSDWLLEPWATSMNFDKVLLDPARAGAEQAVHQIAKLSIPHVLYISCDPATLARDSAILVAKGYKIEKISLIDMFSQTKHVETMLLFTQ